MKIKIFTLSATNGESEKKVAINPANVTKCEEKTEGNTLITFLDNMTAYVKGNLVSVVNQLNEE